MASFHAIYIKGDFSTQTNVENLIPFFINLNDDFTLRSTASKPWVQASFCDLLSNCGQPDQPVETYSRLLAEKLPGTEIIGIGTHSVSDSNVFIRFHEGAMTRYLRTGYELGEGIWDRIEGEPLEWESDILRRYDLEIGQSGFSNFGIYDIGAFYDMPGFSEEPFSVEVDVRPE